MWDQDRGGEVRAQKTEAPSSAGPQGSWGLCSPSSHQSRRETARPWGCPAVDQGVKCLVICVPPPHSFTTCAEVNVKATEHLPRAEGDPGSPAGDPSPPLPQVESPCLGHTRTLEGGVGWGQAPGGGDLGQAGQAGLGWGL